MRVGFLPLSLNDYEPYLASVIFVPNCQLRCPYCHNATLVLNQEKALYTIDEVLVRLQKHKTKVDAVVVSGGEPLISPLTIPLLRKLKGAGFNIKLDSNGGFYNRLKMCIEEKLIDYVAIDYKGLPVSYDCVFGLKKNQISSYFSSLKASIKLLDEHHIPYEIRTTIFEPVHSEQYLEKMMIELEQLNLKNPPPWYLQNYQDHPSNLLYLKQLPLQIKPVSTDVLNRLNKNGYPFKLR